MVGEIRPSGDYAMKYDFHCVVQGFMLVPQYKGLLCWSCCCVLVHISTLWYFLHLLHRGSWLVFTYHEVFLYHSDLGRP